MSFIDDWNNQAAQQAAQTGVTHSWDDYYRTQQQQQALKALQDKNAAPKKKGNFLTSLLPTGGGVGGALAGGAAGAAIGSAVPIVGTAVGGLLGAILGGAGGSAAGKVGENAIEGESDLGKGVAGEALLGGLTSTPIGAGLKLARAGLKVGTGIGKKAAGDLVQEAGIQTLGKGTVKRGVASGRFDDRAGLTAERLYGGNIPGTTINDTVAKTVTDNRTPDVLNSSLSGRLTNAGNKALLSQYGTISKPFARSTDPADTISRLADAGINKPADAERLASLVTGSNGIVTKAVSDTVGKAGGVSVDTVNQVFKDAVENYGLVEKDRKSVEAVFNAQMNKLRGGSRGSIATKFNPTEVLGTMKSLEKRIANLQGKGDNYRLSTPERADQASVLKLVRDELEDSLYTGAGANQQLKNTLTPELRNRLVDLQPNNPKWQNYVDNNIMGAKTVGDLRGSMSPFVRVGKIIDEGENNAATFGGRVGNAFNGGGVKNLVGEALTNIVKNPAANLAGNTLRKAGSVSSGIVPAAGVATKNTVGQGIIPLTAREGTARLLTADAPQDTQLDENGLTADDYAQLQSNPLFAGTQLGGQTDPSLADPSQTQPSNPFGISLQDVAGQMTAALQSGDTKGYAQLSDLYDRINDYETTNGTSGALGATAKSNLASSANGINTLDQLQSLYGQAGGGSGRIVGGVQNFLGNAGFNNNVDLYNSQANSTVTQLAKALNGGGQVTDADARVVIDALPKVTDNPEVAAQKFAALRQRLQVAAQNTAQYGGGSTDLSSILAQYAQ